MKVKSKGGSVRIGEAAQRAGVSPRALRHYEETGLLAPERTPGGYREYDDADVARATQIRTMTAAGVGTELIERYLDCVRTGEHGARLEMCPELRAELDGLDTRLAGEQVALEAKRARLAALLRTPAATPIPSSWAP